MAKSPDNKPTQTSIFQKVLEAGNAYLDSQIIKAKSTIINQNLDEDFLFSKAVVEDPSYSIHSQGYKDKPSRLQNGHLKNMSMSDTAVAGVIQTRQNQVGGHSSLVKSKVEKGWMIVLKDEDALLEKIKEELKAEAEVKATVKGAQNGQETPQEEIQEPQEGQPFGKADQASEGEDVSLQDTEQEDPSDNEKSDDEVEEVDWELERKAREILKKKFEKPRKAVEQFVQNCGKLDNRPFESKKWNFDACLRAWVRDSLTYDLYASEMIPDRAGRIHHFFPVDGGTIKQASKDLKKYRDAATNFFNIDILYPERSKESEAKQKVIDLDPKLLEKDAYKWVQVIRGKIERAYTADELKVGIRNVTTDIYNNGYGISELEILVGMVTGHLNAEFYNQAYFTQGFSAKGILHIKAAINRRKLETVRTQWHHMLKGSKNSFQTPIFAGVEDVKWLPLTQNHNDIGFEGWMRYLITMIGCIYQIDPAEMGIHFKAEGGGGNLGGSKDDTKDKVNNSKDRGLYPLLSHLETYMNENVISMFDSRFVLKFTGVDGEDSKAALERQEKESKFKKTLNEIRAEDGLPPMPGGDSIILGTEFMQWYSQFSPDAIKKQKSDQEHQLKQQEMMGQQGQEEDTFGAEEIAPEQDIYGEGAMNMAGQLPDAMTKSVRRKKPKQVKVEVYKIEK